MDRLKALQEETARQAQESDSDSSSDDEDQADEVHPMKAHPHSLKLCGCRNLYFISTTHSLIL
jgi:hypothetical protein